VKDAGTRFHTETRWDSLEMGRNITRTLALKTSKSTRERGSEIKGDGKLKVTLKHGNSPGKN